MPTCSLSLNSRQSGFFLSMAKRESMVTPEFQNYAEAEVSGPDSATAEEEGVLSTTDNDEIKINFLSFFSGSTVTHYSKIPDDTHIKKDTWNMLFFTEPMIVPHHSAIKEYAGFLARFLPEPVEIDIESEIKRQKYPKRK